MITNFYHSLINNDKKINKNIKLYINKNIKSCYANLKQVLLIISLIMYVQMPELLTAIWTNYPGRIVGLLTTLYIGRVAFDMTLLHFNNKCVQPNTAQPKFV